MSQNERTSLVGDFNDLVATFSDLKDRTQELYNHLVERSMITNQTRNYHDCILESCRYIYEENNRILKIIKEANGIDENKLKQSLAIRRELLDKRIERLNEDNIGTTLNILNNFHGDILSDVKRHRIETILKKGWVD